MRTSLLMGTGLYLNTKERIIGSNIHIMVMHNTHGHQFGVSGSYRCRPAGPAKRVQFSHPEGWNQNATNYRKPISTIVRLFSHFATTFFTTTNSPTTTSKSEIRQQRHSCVVLRSCSSATKRRPRCCLCCGFTVSHPQVVCRALCSAVRTVR